MTLETLGPAAVLQRRFGLPSAEAAAAVFVALVPVVSLAGAQGGFFPSAWGWATIPLLWAAAVALAVRQRVRLSGAELTFVGLLAALGLWILLSAVWSAAPAATILESERGLVYIAAISAALVVSSSAYVGQLLGGLFVGITGIAAFSLATRIFPDRIGVFEAKTVYRLAEPIGYWNGLAIFCGIGGLLAVGFAARARSVVARAASAAALVVLMPTLYFTFGRGPWIALAVGLVTATVGGVVSAAPLSTVTVTRGDVATFPAASRATAVSVCAPFGVGAAAVVIVEPVVIELGVVPPSAAAVIVASSGLVGTMPPYS